MKQGQMGAVPQLNPGTSSPPLMDASRGGSGLFPSIPQHEDSTIPTDLLPVGQFHVILAHPFFRDGRDCFKPAAPSALLLASDAIKFHYNE